MRGTKDLDAADIKALQQQVVLMGQTVENMLEGSVRAIVAHDSARARLVIDQDEEVDRLEKETDGLCLRVLAEGESLGTDFRFAATASRLVNEIERIGDMAVNMCRRAMELNATSTRHHYDVRRMAATALLMIHEALEAMVLADAGRAKAVIGEDDVLDRYYVQISREIEGCMASDPLSIPTAMCVQSIAKDLERIGDHATNIAEMVVFVVEGVDIRHLHPRAV